MLGSFLTTCASLIGILILLLILLLLLLLHIVLIERTLNVVKLLSRLPYSTAATLPRILYLLLLAFLTFLTFILHLVEASMVPFVFRIGLGGGLLGLATIPTILIVIFLLILVSRSVSLAWNLVNPIMMLILTAISFGLLVLSYSAPLILVCFHLYCLQK